MRRSKPPAASFAAERNGLLQRKSGQASGAVPPSALEPRFGYSFADIQVHPQSGVGAILQRQPKPSPAPDKDDEEIRTVPSGLRVTLPDGTDAPGIPAIMEGGVEVLPTTMIYGDEDAKEEAEAQKKKNELVKKYDAMAQQAEKDRQNSVEGYIAGVTMGLFPVQTFEFLQDPSAEKAKNIAKSTAKGLIPAPITAVSDALDDKKPKMAPEKMTAQDWGVVTAPLWGLLFGAATGGAFGGESAPFESGVDTTMPSSPPAPPGGASRPVNSRTVPENCGQCQSALTEGRGSTSSSFASRAGVKEGLSYPQQLTSDLANTGNLTGPIMAAPTEAAMISDLGKYPPGSQAIVYYVNPPVPGVPPSAHYISALVGKGGKVMFVDAQLPQGAGTTTIPQGASGFQYFGVVPAKR